MRKDEGEGERKEEKGRWKRKKGIRKKEKEEEGRWERKKEKE